jgi:hypothetical protein
VQAQHQQFMQQKMAEFNHFMAGMEQRKFALHQVTRPTEFLRKNSRLNILFFSQVGLQSHRTAEGIKMRLQSLPPPPPPPQVDPLQEFRGQLAAECAASGAKAAGILAEINQIQHQQGMAQV